MHPTQRAFLDDIISHPNDNDLRLIYCDWLEQNNQEERAKLTRVQLELVRLGASPEDRFKVPRDSPLGKLWDQDSTLTNRFTVSDSLITNACKQVKWERGFVSWVGTFTEWWLNHGPELVKYHPVETVRLFDKGPRESLSGSGNWGWATIRKPPTLPTTYQRRFIEP